MIDRVRRFFWSVDQRPVLGPLAEAGYRVLVLTTAAVTCATVVLVAAEVG